MQDKGLRVHLKFKTAELSNYPWEALWLDDTYLATSVVTPLIRSVHKEGSIKRNFDRPLKILFIGSSPVSPGYTTVDIDNELDVLEASLRKDIDNGTVKVTRVDKPTANGIIDHLSRDDYNIVHFIGHGVVEGGNGIALEKPDKSLDIVNAERVGQIFQNRRTVENTLGLIILNACQGAEVNRAISTAKAFTGLAPQLIQIGFPAVVAMRYGITNEMAHIFSGEFYANILKMPIDENMQRVRHKILTNSSVDPRDFTSPILFLRSRDGLVFNPISSAAKALIVSSSSEFEIQEFKKFYRELEGGGGDVRACLLQILKIRDKIGEPKDQFERQVLRVISEIRDNVSVLLKHRDQALRLADDSNVIKFEKAIMLNFSDLKNILNGDIGVH